MRAPSHRSWIASLALAAPLAGCTPASPDATAPSTTITAAPSTTSTAAPLPPIASSSPPADDRAARERAEAVLRCRQQRCWHLGKACFDNCHRHGHSRDPEGHTRCNESCRASHGIEACEAECEREPAVKRER